MEIRELKGEWRWAPRSDTGSKGAIAAGVAVAMLADSRPIDDGPTADESVQRAVDVVSACQGAAHMFGDYQDSATLVGRNWPGINIVESDEDDEPDRSRPAFVLVYNNGRVV